MSDKQYKEEQELEKKFGLQEPRRIPRGFSVPEGYFAKMQEEVMGRIAESEPVERYVEMTRWQKLKPYVYLAAMFCGIWLMMNVFHRVTGYGDVSLENPPEHIAQLMNQPEVTEPYRQLPTVMSDMEVQEDVMEEYDNMQEFVEDFREADAELENEITDDEIN